MLGIGCFCSYIWSYIRHVVGSIVFSIVSELAKFAAVLFLAYMIACAIFELWSQIIPDAPSSQRLSAAATAILNKAARLSGLSDTDYPFVIDLPTQDKATSTMSTSGSIVRASSSKRASKAAEAEAVPDAEAEAAAEAAAEAEAEAEDAAEAAAELAAVAAEAAEAAEAAAAAAEEVEEQEK